MAPPLTTPHSAHSQVLKFCGRDVEKMKKSALAKEWKALLTQHPESSGGKGVNATFLDEDGEGIFGVTAAYLGYLPPVGEPSYEIVQGGAQVSQYILAS